MENKFKSICDELVTLQKAKNTDYGDSFSKSVKEFGLTAALIPITNKVSRLKQLIQSNEAQVKDESIDDTLKDLACYAIMTLAERKISLSDAFFKVGPDGYNLLADYLKKLRENSGDDQYRKIDNLKSCPKRKDTCIGKLYFHVIPIIHKTKIR